MENCNNKAVVQKKGAREDTANYRPVALLCVSGMILERVITEQLEAHLEENGLMGPYQFGYRKKGQQSQQWQQ